LELSLEVFTFDRPPGICVADDVILENRDPAELVGWARRRDVWVLAWTRSAGESRNDDEREAQYRIHGRTDPWGREGYSLPSKKSTVRRVDWKPQTLAVVVKNERGPGPPVGAAWYEDRVRYEATVACRILSHAFWRRLRPFVVPAPPLVCVCGGQRGSAGHPVRSHVAVHVRLRRLPVERADSCVRA